MPSFDVEVKADAVELRNAVDQAQKEIGTRYDFRGTKASVEQKDLELYLVAESDFQLRQVRDVLIGKLAKRGIRNLKMVDVCTVSLADSFTEILRRSHIVLAASTMNMTVNPLMSAFLAICTEMNVTNRKVSIIGNSSWTPNVSGQLMKDVVSKWKNCELLGDPVHIVSSMPDDDADIEKLADIIAEDILKEK